MIHPPPISTLFPYTTLFRSLHGSARGATVEDIRETGLLDSRQGVYVGGWKPGRRSCLHYLRHGGPQHVLVFAPRSEEHTSELQSQSNLVCRILLEKKEVTHV